MHPLMMYSWPENLGYRIKSLGGDRFGAGVPSFTLLKQSPGGASDS